MADGTEKARTAQEVQATLWANLAGLARVAFNTIGNSTVTGMFFLAIAIVTTIPVWDEFYGDDYREVLNAQTRERVANARRMEIINDEKTTATAIGTFGPITADYVDDSYSAGEGVVITFSAVKNAVRYEFAAAANSTEIPLLVLNAPTPDSMGLIVYHVPMSHFGEHSTQNAYIRFRVFAADTQGRYIQAGSQPGFRIPQANG